MATALTIVCVAPMSATNTKAGRSPANAGPRSSSMPGHPPRGTPIHGASATRTTS